jgi:hypothetical protein
VSDSEPAVKVNLPAIVKSWRQAGESQVWVLVRTKTGTQGQFEQAVYAANDAAIARGEDGDTYAEFPSVARDGFVTLLSYSGRKAALQNWTNDLARALTAGGITATLTGTTSSTADAWLGATMPITVATGFVAWTLDLKSLIADERRNSHWHVPESATLRIAELAEQWGQLPDADILLRQNIFNVMLPEDVPVAPPLARAISETGMAGLDYLLTADKHARHIALSAGGSGIFQVIGGPQDWRERIGQLREAITALPGDTDHAYIRPGHADSGSSSQVAQAQPLPGIEEPHVRANKHLQDRYLPDAHGIQVVRDAHLERAHNLSNWDITDLGHGRHLVEANDLKPWYADTLPDPDVVTQARADFAGALLTLDILNDNPPPWQPNRRYDGVEEPAWGPAPQDWSALGPPRATE